MSETQLRGTQILDGDITSDDLADASVRGATGNAGVQREVASGTISTGDLRDDAVNAAKLLETDSYVVGTLTVGGVSGSVLVVNSTNLIVDATTGSLSSGGSPVAGAILALTSTSKGFLPPRMTSTQRTAITAPEGLLVYDTTVKQWFGHNGSAWVILG